MKDQPVDDFFTTPYTQKPLGDGNDTFWFEMYFDNPVKPFPIPNRWLLVWDVSDELQLALFYPNGDDLTGGIWKFKGSNWDYFLPSIKRWAYIGEGLCFDKTQFFKNPILSKKLKYMIGKLIYKNDQSDFKIEVIAFADTKTITFVFGDYRYEVSANDAARIVINLANVDFVAEIISKIATKS